MEWNRNSTTVFFREDERQRTLEEIRIARREMRLGTPARGRGERRYPAWYFIPSAMIAAAMIYMCVMFLLKKPLDGAWGAIAAGAMTSLFSFLPDSSGKRRSMIGKITAAVVLCALAGAAWFLRQLQTGAMFLDAKGWLLVGAAVSGAAAAACMLGMVLYVRQLNRRRSTEMNAEVIGYLDRIKTTKNHSEIESTPVYRLHYNGMDHEVYYNIFRTNSFVLPRIGDKVMLRFNPEDPCDCKPEHEHHELGGVILLEVVLAAFAIGFFVAAKLDMSNAPVSNKNTQSVFDDRYVQKMIKSDRYLVVERRIIKIDDGTLFFEEVGGLDDSICSRDQYETGDSVYWIENDNAVHIFNTKKWKYVGDKTIANSDQYIDGRYILTDVFLKEKYQAEQIVVTEVIIKDNTSEYIQCMDLNGESYRLNINSDMPRYQYYCVGDPAYMITFGGEGALLLSAFKNVYVEE